MSKKRAKIYCDSTCCVCGSTLGRYYENHSTISSLKEELQDWIWDDELQGNVCPSCQEDLKNKDVEQTESFDIFDMWSSIQ